MIQAAQVASKFTLFTHHAKTFPNLVTALRNSMLRTGVFTNEKTAEEQVVQVLNFDIHLVKDFRGRRYIERVTECIPLEDKNDYTFEHQQEKTMEGKIQKFMDNATKYFTKVTNKELYKYVNIMEYINDEYVITNKISDYNLNEMRNNMDASDVDEFDAFIEKNWGSALKQPVSATISQTDNYSIQPVAKHRGRPSKK
jgi:pilus assembly protein CpaF